MKFYETKKGIIITAVIASVLVLSIAIGSIFLFKGKDKTDDGSSTDTSGASSDNSIVIADIEKDSSDNSDDSYLEPDETEADKILEEYKNKTESQASGSVSAPTTSQNTTTNNNTQVNTNNNTTSSNSGVTVPGTATDSNPWSKFVQPANPDTGISWDGVSPIIYTYPDGTTGTEKREGAKYEGAPGMWTTVVTIPTGGEYNPCCTYCGKPSGDGTNGTCARWSLVAGGVTCPNCGVHVPQATCHYCGQ